MITAFDPSLAEWVKSSYSGGNGGDCLEFSRTFAAFGVIPVRDSKDPDGPALAFTPDAWTAFLEAVKAAQF